MCSAVGNKTHYGLCPDTCKKQACHGTKLDILCVFNSSFLISHFSFFCFCLAVKKQTKKKHYGAIMLCADESVEVAATMRVLQQSLTCGVVTLKDAPVVGVAGRGEMLFWA